MAGVYGCPGPITMAETALVRVNSRLVCGSRPSTRRSRPPPREPNRWTPAPWPSPAFPWSSPCATSPPTCDAPPGEFVAQRVDIGR